MPVDASSPLELPPDATSTTLTGVPMRHLAALALIVAVTFPALASAKPHRAHKAKPRSAAAERFIADCVHERTGPTDGITTKEALKLCTGIVKHNTRIDKARAKAVKAIEACEQAIVDACVDAADGTEPTTCEDDQLKTAFAICH